MKTIRQSIMVSLGEVNLQVGRALTPTSVKSSSLAALYRLLQMDCLSIRVSGSPTLLPISFHAVAAPTYTYTNLGWDAAYDSLPTGRVPL